MNEAKYNPDVLSCLANLSNDEVFTPPVVVNRMLDMLPQELFESPDTKFLDIGTKSGVFLREIAKRLIKGLEKKIPDLQERVDHILHNQLFGIATTELTSLVSRRTLYCSKYPNCRYSASKFDTVEGNIRFRAIKHTFVNGRCKWCGASEAQFDRDDGLESHAYEFIHTDRPEELFNMKFDVIVGNPPYQMSDGSGGGAGAVPIYQKFVAQAKKLNSRFLIMIIPARWYSGGRGLDNFRDVMLNDRSLRYLVDYIDSEDCFPGVDVAGGICYFLRDSLYHGDCNVKTIHGNCEIEALRDLGEFRTFIRHPVALSIVKKVLAKSRKFVNEIVSSQKPFGLRTYVTPDVKGDLKLRYNKGVGSFKRENVCEKIEWIDKWKIIMSYLTADHAGRADSEGKRKIFSSLEILPPDFICTETYIVAGVFDCKKKADNFHKYLKTMVVRFLVAQIATTQHISKSSFRFVPMQDFSKPWTDEELYKKYNLTKDEIAFIESMIKPME